MKTYQHIIFWVLVYGILTLVFAKWFDSYVEAFYYVSLLLPVVIGTSYFFNFYLVPQYLFKRRFSQFILYSIYMFVVSLCLEMVAGISAMLLIIYYGVNETGALITDVFTLALVLYFIVLFKSFILLIKHYFVDQNAIGELERKQSQIEKGYFTIKSNRQTSRVMFEDLVFIESLADYIKIHQSGENSITSKEKISHIEKELPDTFLRIHRSFIVNTNKIASFTREFVMMGEKELPIGRTYKKEVVSRLKKDQF